MASVKARDSPTCWRLQESALLSWDSWMDGQTWPCWMPFRAVLGEVPFQAATDGAAVVVLSAEVHNVTVKRRQGLSLGRQHRP